MTDTAAPAKPGFLTGFVTTVAVLAVIAWLGGVALNKGFGVHAPFIASWLLLVTGLTLVKAAAAEVAQAWHIQAVQAAGPTAAADVMGAHMAERILEDEEFLSFAQRLEAEFPAKAE
jgi:hypothetical protein